MSEASKDRQLDIFQAAYVDIPIRDQRDLMERQGGRMKSALSIPAS